MQRETYDKCGKSVDKSFHKEDKDGSCEDKEKMSFHQVKVQQHACRNKKNAHEHIPERYNISKCLHGVL